MRNQEFLRVDNKEGKTERLEAAQRLNSKSATAGGHLHA